MTPPCVRQSCRERTQLGMPVCNEASNQRYAARAARKWGAGRGRAPAKTHQTPLHDPPSVTIGSSHHCKSATIFQWTVFVNAVKTAASAHSVHRRPHIEVAMISASCFSPASKSTCWIEVPELAGSAGGSAASNAHIYKFITMMSPWPFVASASRQYFSP
eukprot:366431-Chlamydomonas_euryale.AAC.5